MKKLRRTSINRIEFVGGPKDGEALRYKGPRNDVDLQYALATIDDDRYYKKSETESFHYKLVWFKGVEDSEHCPHVEPRLVYQGVVKKESEGE